MLRAIIGTVTTVLAGVRMLLTSNQKRLDVFSDWIFFCCGLALLLQLMFDARHHWHPARRVYMRSIRDREARALRTIDNLRKSPFLTPIDYDPRDGSITAGFGINPTWNRRAVEAVSWLANRHMLPRKVTIMMAGRLGRT